jgi:LDH2 family malate/lactate/ureidoglycolate dehydrogenase
MTENAAIVVDAARLETLAANLFAAVGVDAETARIVAQALVEADLEGQRSHGVMLIEMYIDRLLNGSVSLAAKPDIVEDNAACLVLDGKHALGHVIGDQAMDLACGRAQDFGLGAVAVRNGFHFGTARRFALQAAQRGLIGIAMCNTRPLMPAPGGAERLVGNNPMAIALPVSGETPAVLDMATSEAAMGKIRMADKAGEAIPATWASDAAGTPTTDPAEAIEGMLLPAAGPKGFGLSFMIDLLCGGLSGGNWGDGIEPLYGNPAVPYGCAHFFLAIDPGHFGSGGDFAKTAQAAIDRIHDAGTAPGTDRLYAPGEPEWTRRKQANGQLELDETTAAALAGLAETHNVALGGLRLTPLTDEDLEHAQA